MTEQMTTDQRVALALITTLQSTAAVVNAFAAAADDTDLGKLAQRQVDAQNQNGERLLELSQALAAGKVRIVDEGELVRQVAQAFAEKLTQQTADGISGTVGQLREAQLFVLRMKDAGVLR